MSTKYFKYNYVIIFFFILFKMFDFAAGRAASERAAKSKDLIRRSALVKEGLSDFSKLCERPASELRTRMFIMRPAAGPFV